MRVSALVLALVGVAAAQNSPDWRKVGGASVNLALAVSVGLRVGVKRGAFVAYQRVVGKPLVHPLSGLGVGRIGPNAFGGEVRQVDGDDVVGIAGDERGLLPLVEHVVGRRDEA